VKGVTHMAKGKKKNAHKHAANTVATDSPSPGRKRFDRGKQD